MPRHGSLLFLLMLGGLAGAAPAPVQLLWKLKEGDSFAVEEVFSSRRTVTIKASETRLETDQTLVSRFTVLKQTADGDLLLEQKIESVKASSGGPGTKAVTQVLQHLEGATFLLRLDARLRLAHFEGYDKLIERVTARDEDAGKLLRAGVTVESLKRSAAGLFGWTPGKAVTVGDTWQVKARLPFGPLGALDQVDTYTYQGVDPAEKDVVKIGVAAVLTYVPPGGDALPFKVSGGTVKMKEAKGSLFFNIASGRLVRSETQQSLQLPLTIAGQGQNLAMDVEIQQSTTLRVLEKSPPER